VIGSSSAGRHILTPSPWTFPASSPSLQLVWPLPRPRFSSVAGRLRPPLMVCPTSNGKVHLPFPPSQRPTSASILWISPTSKTSPATSRKLPASAT